MTGRLVGTEPNRDEIGSPDLRELVLRRRERRGGSRIFGLHSVEHAARRSAPLMDQEVLVRVPPSATWVPLSKLFVPPSKIIRTLIRTTFTLATPANARSRQLSVRWHTARLE